MEPVEQVLVGSPESLPSTDLDRRDGDMHGVDEICLEKLPNSGDAASAGVASMKWNVVSDSVKLGR